MSAPCLLASVGGDGDKRFNSKQLLSRCLDVSNLTLDID